MDGSTLADIAKLIGVIMIVSLVAALVLLALIARKLKRIEVRPGAGFIETLQAAPLSLMIVLDLLDLGLDFLSAPIAWALLSRYGLEALREVAVVESIIPGTQFIPTLTLAWLYARFQPPQRPQVRSATLSDGSVVEVSGRVVGDRL